MNDLGYLDKVTSVINRVREEQMDNILKGAELMAKAIEKDELIHVYGGGGHTTLVMGEIFFRAGGLANINPIMEPGLSVFNQALKYLELERTVNYGSSIVKYFRIQPGEVLIIFHNIGINPATIDAAMEAKENGAKIIAVSSSYWQNEMPKDHDIRHPNAKNLFDYADVCIDDYNPVGDSVIEVKGLDSKIGPISNMVDFYIAHLLEIIAIQKCVERGVEPPIWASANAPGGDAINQKYIDKYLPRIKYL
ncbi:sugar isomerase domain-containing protein [Membranicola marinus]|uniref:Sugar isomerase domain-containing protein n=1 Tax=Membranihabitans marinus TaxID=1227546 RepID=A0A953LDR9_9BACT|nr:sugar isomerase domain-containing protein [Membranihabitans marinus]MBY5959174.1 sugar isomerase domain-containing protein [Membranihabitans marinus]